MRFVHRTHKGNIREINEDYYYVPKEDGNLFILADGMGGHLAGETASKMAVETVVEELSKKEFKSTEELIESLKEAVRKSNEIVYKKSLEELNLRGMGTTISIVYVYDNKFFYTNVGDSRIYRIDGSIEQITRDDSFVNYLVDLGEITEEEAKEHPKKNVITRAIGTSENLIPEVMSFDLNSGKILMCSDGLSNMVSNEEMLKVLQNEELEDSADELLEKALKAGGIDNITFIIIEIK
ncbi:protein phosphatase [Peptoniphilus asaccharolyticus DSM 20463]|uniref:Protein phosphatase n=1 Tax=Peptoniphilus asaccharolyticus DSM 20463 TaxID=573058 RepID=A0A1W1UX29_PEPAS|nr:Stp1/IreP family PP2C-type Ser/Thr phosphatase [Peptoniphilus asaccharolyticus]MBL7575273.1 Stp1/IreP family PP2C-type Ser/Thr phosphatase [Peptoniphilus asaccharolyticus]SMB85254.1 protein phosphatase [Peptoniphilus asaccharolyticus DSM 20463]